ncbi:acyl-CoA desaturase [Actinokineospora xionganensis]|uniref:Acyl-CoA desaturase n=1 Tax=Actinokineospora xionganensis TaxID=2684470 RepID=A0ABR7L9G7_9PSEU|nr:acyl-CoA desaturase [Actinokineospora xionganensis]MBC6449345.1 acyl-CoA desaturase [Actinokineospora xionganensis]
MSASSSVLERPPKAPKPIFGEPASRTEIITIRAFLIIPFIALLAAVPLMWGWGVSWVDLTVAAVFYTVSTLGVTIGFHRYFTHGAFKAARPLRIALAIAGMLAAQGSVLGWVADHRRHHAFSDREGDPHSPWLFGTSPKAILRGFWHAHMGWLFGRDRTNIDRFAPDLAEDRDIQVLDKLFPLWVTLSVGLPAVIGGLVTMSWWGALTGFLWAGLARVAFQHHVTWSTNSICHMIGSRPFTSRDRSANFWPLAILSMGESWHNSHHADPTSARHGVLRGQIDISARLIWVFEKLGWVWQVRWPTQERLEKLAVSK